MTSLVRCGGCMTYQHSYYVSCPKCGSALSVPVAVNMLAAIKMEVVEHPGTTSREICDRTGMYYNSVSVHLNKLVHYGEIRRGEPIPNGKGCWRNTYYPASMIPESEAYPGKTGASARRAEEMMRIVAEHPWSTTREIADMMGGVSLAQVQQFVQRRSAIGILERKGALRDGHIRYIYAVKGAEA